MMVEDAQPSNDGHLAKKHHVYVLARTYNITFWNVELHNNLVIHYIGTANKSIFYSIVSAKQKTMSIHKIGTPLRFELGTRVEVPPENYDGSILWPSWWFDTAWYM